MRRYLLLVLIMAVCFSAQAQERFLSKLYFPGLVGLDIHLYDGHLNYKNGIVLNTGMEFRPVNTPIFFRFNYDALGSRYKSNPLSTLPTNVSNGTLHLNYFLAGVGYRKRNKLTGWYLLAQTGLEQRTYDKVTVTSDGFTIDQVGKKALGVKFTAGLEYYLAEHFALVLEPAFYPGSYYALQASSNKNLSVSIGFTTTLF
ncbi:MAG: porin family protein [Bacteroidota bacterium]|nr:porin family protein [Bacteroidota bacterium]